MKSLKATGVLGRVAVSGIILAAVLSAPVQHVTAPLPQAPFVSEEHVVTPKRDLTVAAYGDSITAWIDRNNVAVLSTWPNHLGAGVRFEPAQGWAKGGAKIAEMVENVTPVSADVLIIAAGTNDEGDRWGTPMEDRLAGIDQIVTKSGAKRVILDAVPPRNSTGALGGNPVWATDWNAQLKALAAARGWDFFDPWSFLRAADGQYVAGTTVEGVHPTAASQLAAAAAITAYLLDARYGSARIV
jgi:lysophospholipase L1-like esterase